MYQDFYRDAAPNQSQAYLWPALRAFIASRSWPQRRVLDLGCGNGATAAMLGELGWDVVAIDSSPSGIAQAHGVAPRADCEVASVYDDLASRYRTFPLVISLEVIEHCADVRGFARSFLSLIAPGGTGFLTTPYHGYLKYLLIGSPTATIGTTPISIWTATSSSFPKPRSGNCSASPAPATSRSAASDVSRRSLPAR